MEYSQNHFCLIWRLMIAVLVSTSVNIAHAGEDDTALQLRDNVVSIVTEFRSHDDRWKDQGFGFIVGERNGKAIIVTANHVVRSKHPRPDQRTESVSVTYHSDQGRSYKAQLLGTHNAQLDLAVLEVTLPAHVTWYSDSLDRKENIRRGTKVWYIGRSGRWHVPTTPGKINDEALGGSFNIDDLSVRPGTSGAPVVSPAGILGMVITDSTGEESQAISVEVIEKAIRRWNLPWHLSYAPAYSGGREEPAVVEPSDDLDFWLGDDPMPQPSAQMGPDISGYWGFQMGNYMFGVFVPSGAGSFDIRKTGPDQYQFSQYTPMNQLESSGTIYYEDGFFYLDGTMHLLGPYSATLEPMGGQLSGTIWMQGVEAVITLMR